MSVKEYQDALQLAHEASQRALRNRDEETHFLWGKAYHRLAAECLTTHGIELRPS